MIGVCVDPDLPAADVISHSKDFGLKFPVVQDREGKLARQVGATVTPEAFVIDSPARSATTAGSTTSSPTVASPTPTLKATNFKTLSSLFLAARR